MSEWKHTYWNEIQAHAVVLYALKPMCFIMPSKLAKSLRTFDLRLFSCFLPILQWSVCSCAYQCHVVYDHTLVCCAAGVGNWTHSACSSWCSVQFLCIYVDVFQHVVLALVPSVFSTCPDLSKSYPKLSRIRISSLPTDSKLKLNF